MSDQIDMELLRAAFDRIARTPDGELLYRYLQFTRMDVLSDTDVGALNRDAGRRSLAATLMSYMAEGIDASGGPTDPTNTGKPSGRPVVFVAAKPVAAVRRQSAREWLAAADPATGGGAS